MMSYCRVNLNGRVNEHAEWSDVYVFEHVGGWFECCGCIIKDPNRMKNFVCDYRSSMLTHLFEHIKAGHEVPRHAFAGLYMELAEDCMWPYKFAPPTCPICSNTKSHDFKDTEDGISVYTCGECRKPFEVENNIATVLEIK